MVGAYTLIYIQQYNIILTSPKMLPQDPTIRQSVFLDPNQIQQLVQITSTPITQILSYSNAYTSGRDINAAENGFCIVNNISKKFRKFQHADNPFAPQSTGGISIGSILDQRTEVALVPRRRTKIYSNTTVYIYEYNLKSILYSNNFFLPIRQLTLTDQSIIVSNNKRIIIYNYDQDTKNKDQKYYLSQYESTSPNTRLRYLQMFCSEKFMNNSIPDQEDQNTDEPIDLMGKTGTSYRNGNFCKCGQYRLSSQKPHKLVYCQVYTNNGEKRISLGIYDWAIDKEYAFQTVDYSEEFLFAISADGRYLAYSEEEGRKIRVYKTSERNVHQTLRVSRSIKLSAACGFFLAKGSLWFTIIRKQGNNNGHMHIFKISESSKQQLTQSSYKRYFGLYDRTFKDYNISDQMIGPDFYVDNEVLYSYSLCGIVHDVINFNRSGNLQSKIVENFVIWSEDS